MVTSFRRQFLSIVRDRQFAAWIFAGTLLTTLGGWQTKMSPWRVGEWIWFKEIPGRIPDTEAQKKSRQPGFANMQYQPGKSFRAIDLASNVAAPPIVFLTCAAFMAVMRRRAISNNR